MSDSVIRIEGFAKSFGSKEVVRDLSFEVGAGETFAFLGANGSGKTTTIRCLLGLLTPSKGVMRIFDQDYGPALAPKVGYLPEERGLYSDASVYETLKYFGELRGMSSMEAKKQSEEYLERVGLIDKKNERIKRLSSGQQQKVQLGIAILNQPKLLILDEPTRGLDPVNRSLLMDLLDGLKAQGSTIVFITHLMDEVERIADRLVMLKNGKRVLYGGVREVKESFGERMVDVRYKGDFPRNAELYEVELGNDAARLTLRPEVNPESVLRYLIEQNVAVSHFSLALPSLQEIFVRIQQDNAI
ncbi:MAG: ABC transporter ATP-binding protein [Candidatus Nomurabacteria bacterium]|nr:MAG: ABC transporter ATP-binding protein [Candidatus Nomurabacteria bacterium]